jgi:nitrate reductase assembly molybdenum cofactor insertion protein NarJ
LREFRIDDVETRLCELFDATRKVTLFLDQITWRHNKGVKQGSALQVVGVMDKDSGPLIRINLSPFRDKYNLD